MTRLIEQVFPISLLFLFVCGCQPKSIVGLYSTAKSKTISFVAQDLHLKDDGTFTYDFSSDDLNSNKKGRGDYQFLNKKLILNFKAMETRHSSITKNIASPKFKNILKLYVQDLEEQPLIGVTFTLRDDQEKVLMNGISNEKGNCVLQWKEGELLGSIEASYTGFTNLIAPLDQDVALDYTISLSHTFRSIEAGTIWEYDTKIQKGKMRVTKEGRTLTYYKQVD